MTKIRVFLKGVRVVAVVCSQWGDSGKGKVIDVLAEWAEINARGTGGDNAGHTIVINGQTYVVHLIPSGILRPGVINVIGSGVVVNPRVLLEEIALLTGQGVSVAGLRLAHNAKLLLPHHIMLDLARESCPGKIGTTGRGIGPAYEDHCGRRGLTITDMLNPDVFVSKLRHSLEAARRILGSYDLEVLKAIAQIPRLSSGAFWDEKNFLNLDAVVEAYQGFGQELKGVITDTDTLMRQSLGQKNILLEGAQGTLLSVDYGSYPFVTSSDASVHGLAKGVGLNAAAVDLTLNVVKAFYMTRVGEGPFPTELGGQRSAEWCANGSRDKERQTYPALDWGDCTDDFQLGVKVRQQGGEYGATTGRPRRTGWLDLPLLRYSSAVAGRHGQHVVLTKLDVLTDCSLIKICTNYRYVGPPYHLGQRLLTTGMRLSAAIPDTTVLAHCQPVYQDFPGWTADISHATSRAELPERLKTLIAFVEQKTGVTADALSVGPDREQFIIK